MSRIVIKVSNGKYTFEETNEPGDAPARILILRHGEPWIVQEQAFNAIHSMMCELDAARVVLTACRDLGDDAPREIKNALERHRGLVDDNVTPSDWALPWEPKL